MAAVSLMVLYEDESVEVRYSDGSWLQLSPCGSEFLFDKTPPVSAHPLQPSERIRQRTRFVISSYKELIVQALEFRNRFASRPYLPAELIPADKTARCYHYEREVGWPALSSGCAKLGDDGTVAVSSVDGKAVLRLSATGQEFWVEFLCKASQKSARPAILEPKTEFAGGSGNAKERSRDKNPKVTHSEVESAETQEDNGDRHPNARSLRVVSSQSGTSHRFSEPAPRQAYLCTWVVQHHSMSSYLSLWHHPLSLAVAFRNSVRENNSDAVGDKDAKTMGQTCQPRGADVMKEEASCLPESLPLSCPLPHQHRWNFKERFSQGDQEMEQLLRTELVSVVWCQGVVYRLIRSTVCTIEAYPGDGSVIRSKGAVANYFTHHFAKDVSCQTDEKMYFLNSLPPDVPGQRYSVSSVVTRASRILQCYNQCRLSLKLPNTFCCWKEESSLSALQNPPVLIEEAYIPNTGRFSAYSDGRVHVLFWDGTALHMMWNFSSQGLKTQGRGTFLCAPGGQQVSGWCQLTRPDGQCHLVQVQAPGIHDRYVGPALNWCKWIDQAPQSRKESARGVQMSDPSDEWSVECELQKIKRFNFLLENSGLVKTAASDASKLNYVSGADGGGSSGKAKEKSIAEALARTSQTIKDIETLLANRATKSHNAV